MIKTAKELAKMVADELNKAIVESECETFKEMRSLYDWDANDIKREILSTAQMMLNNEWEELEEENGIEWVLENVGMNRPMVLDDGTVCEKKTDYTWGQFKKMVMETVA